MEQREKSKLYASIVLVAYAVGLAMTWIYSKALNADFIFVLWVIYGVVATIYAFKVFRN